MPDRLKDNLQAWYCLDGDLGDAHGGHHGTLVVGAAGWGADRSANPKGALVPPGDMGATLPGIILAGTSFSIQFWTLNPQRWIIGQGEGTDAHGLHIGAGAKGMRFDYWGNDLVAPLDAPDHWSHWVLTHDLATGRKSTWRNGERLASEVSTPYLGTGDITLGRHFSGGGFYAGALDDVAFWRSALAAEDIAALHNGGKGLSYSPKAASVS